MNYTTLLFLTFAFVPSAAAQAPWEQWTRRSCSSFPSNGKIEGSQYDNSYFEGCTLRGAREDAVFIKNVDNFAIVGFDIADAGREGIKLSSSSGASSNTIYIVGNTVTDVEGDGIACPQRFANGVVHRNVKIWNNTVIRSAKSNNGKKRHGIYNQCQDAEVIGNYVEDNRNGNGITMRSSGVVRGNRVRYLSNNVYPAPYGINYYSDHMVGPSGILVIENNVIDYDSFVGNGNHEAIALLNPVRSPYHNEGEDGYVRSFVIRGNAIVSTDGSMHIDIDDDWQSLTDESDNVIFTSYSAVPADWTDGANEGGGGSSGDPGNSDPTSEFTARASDDDGANIAQNILDGDLDTRWSALGEGQYIEILFPETRSISSVQLAVFRGDERRQSFRIETISEDSTLTNPRDYVTAGSGLELEQFAYSADVATGIRITGFANSYNDWNSITEVVVETSSPTFTVTISASASTHQAPNRAENVLDGDLSTRWSARGDGHYLDLVFSAPRAIHSVGLAIFKGDTRRQEFSLEALDEDGNPFGSELFVSSGSTLDLERFAFEASSGHGVRITGYGNTSNNWNSITEVSIEVGRAGGGAPLALNSNSSSSGLLAPDAPDEDEELALDATTSLAPEFNESAAGCAGGGTPWHLTGWFALGLLSVFRRRRAGSVE
ncbi:MAG: discoidin domain-containing protein [Myxococcota bacterium]